MIGVLSRLVEFCRHYAWAVLGAAALAAVASGVYAADTLGVNTDTSDLFSPKLPWRQQQIAFDHAFPRSANQTVIVLDGASSDAVEDATAALTAALKQQSDRFLSIYRPDGGEFFDRYGLMFLSAQELGQLSTRVAEAEPLLGPLAADPSLRGLFGVFDQALDGLEQGEASADRLAGPMDRFAEAIQSVVDHRPMPVDWGQLMTGQKARPEELRHFIQVQPKLDYDALEPGEAADRLIMDLAGSLHLAEHGVRVRLTGDVPLNDAQFAAVTEGVGPITGLSLLLVVTIMLIGLRAPFAIVAITLTLLFGLVLTAAFAAASVGTLNMVSVPFAVLFIGLGVDFGIQFSMRWRAELFELADETPARRANLALGRTARGISAPLGLAALAVAVGFLSFVPTDYQGVSELGLIAGTSMVIALLANLTVLPALLALLPARGRPEATGFSWAAAPDRWLHQHARLVLGAGLLAAAASCAAIPNLRFDADPLDLQNPKTPAVATALDLVGNPETAPNIDLLLPNLTAAAALGDRLERLPEVRQVLSLASFVPDDQPEKLDAIEQMQLFLGPVLDPGNQLASPDAAADRVATDHFEQHLRHFLAGPAGAALAQPGQHLADALTRFFAMTGGGDVEQLRQILLGGFPGRIAALRTAMTAGKLSVETMPPEFKADWVAADGQARLAVFPKGNTRDPATLGRFVDAVRALAPDATGDPILVLETGRTVSRAFVTASAYALVGITLVLVLFLRRALEVMLVIIPLILAALYTLGTSVLIGIAFNYANIIAVPLLMGIGVAFDIYFVMLWRTGGEKIALLQTPTARAVVFSAGTTATAFGSLALSHHVGTASMGILLIIALFFVLVSTLLVQPALMTLAARRRP
jgi:uncharacterized protein